MELNIKYKNDCPDFHGLAEARLNSDIWQEPTVFLKVDNSIKSNIRKEQDIIDRTRLESLSDILFNLEYLVRDLKILAGTDIEEIELKIAEKTAVKKGTEVNSYTSDNSILSLTNTVVYHFYSDVFKEKLYFTNGLGEKVRNAGLDETCLNKKVLSNPDKLIDLKDLESLMMAVQLSMPNYDVRLVDGKLYYSYKGKIIHDIEKIKDDAVFLIFKFMELILTKDSHFGIFFIDTALFKPEALSGLVFFINLVFRHNGVVFLYNYKNDLDLRKCGKGDYKEIILPNHKLADYKITGSSK